MEYMHFGCVVWTLGVVWEISNLSVPNQAKQTSSVVLGGSWLLWRRTEGFGF